MNACGEFRLVWARISDILLVAAPIASAIISICVYRRTVNRDRKILTLKHLSKLRTNYPQYVPFSNRLDYLRDMEFFCTGINEGIYDINVVRKMCGKRLLRQYNSYMRSYVALRRAKPTTSSEAWAEYERVMQKLDMLYNCNGCFFRKWLCRKCK